jgi:monofunctional glycosyltransferase
MLRKTSGFGRSSGIARWILRLFLLFLLGFASLIVAYRFVMPVSTLMLLRMVTHERVERVAAPLSAMSPSLIAAVITSEDARFCQEHGVDWGALREVIDDSGEDGPSRGASTITMQVARNLFLWQGRSYIRKGLEIPLAVLLDLVWPKRRILEIYLNIAEWGDDGIFGAEAASRTYFDKNASLLNPRESALLVGVLPDPEDRDPRHPDRALLTHARIVMNHLRAGTPVLSCLR